MSSSLFVPSVEEVLTDVLFSPRGHVPSHSLSRGTRCKGGTLGLRDRDMVIPGTLMVFLDGPLVRYRNDVSSESGKEGWWWDDRVRICRRRTVVKLSSDVVRDPVSLGT